jgi:hypothetical protein
MVKGKGSGVKIDACILLRGHQYQIFYYNYFVVYIQTIDSFQPPSDCANITMSIPSISTEGGAIVAPTL